MAETEFGGEMDKKKTLFKLPRPVLNASEKVRAINLTGDETGNSDTDGRFSFRGLDRERFVALSKRSKRRKKVLPDRVIEVGDEQA